MHKVGYTSVKAVIRKVNSDFFPSNNGWHADAMGWIGEGLEEIGTGIIVEKTFKTMNVSDYKLYIPPGILTILGVTYGSQRLPLLNGTLDIDASLNTEYEAAPISNEHYYMSNRPSYLDFSFESGEVKLFYEGVALDCDGFPMIPDYVYFMEALAFRILWKLLGRGMTHPVWTMPMAQQQWEYYKSRASGYALTPTPDQWNTIMNSWNTFVPNFDAVWR